MVGWASRDTLVDVAINVVPMLILLYFVALTLLATPWDEGLRTTVLTHALTLFPVVVLAFATYHVARAVELDAAR